MKLRLSITDLSGQSTVFEHAGPLVRIGRDPSCEVTFSEEGNGVSRQHALIAMSEQGATIADTGSSNGTLLNDCMIKGTVPLQVGDRVRMGYTGPFFTVIELDLPPTTPASAAPARRMMLIGGLAGIALVGAVVLAIVWPRGAAQRGPEPAPAAPLDRNAVDMGAAQPAGAALANSGNEPSAPVSVSRATEDTARVVPSEEVKPIGSYVALPNWVSVLVERQGENYPWAVLRPEARLATGRTLVSLPGYQSLIALDSEVQLTLWGNLPEFSAFPPVLESVVMLNAPSPGTDLDFTLDRGRVVVANRKTSRGVARVRLRFLHEVWDLEMLDNTSEVALELWAIPPRAPAGPKPPPPATCLGLFTKGRVQLETPGERLELGDHSRVSWVNREPTVLHRASLPALPTWWAKPPDPKAVSIRKARSSLLDWSDRLGGSNTGPKSGSQAAAIADVAAAIQTQVEGGEDLDDQDVGVFFLAALDRIKPLVSLLKDPLPLHSNVRGATLFALQSWLARGSEHDRELAGILQELGSSGHDSERIVRLLHFYPPDALSEKKTYEDLVESLDDGNFLVRVLAFWQLDRLGAGGRLPEEARRIDYDPAASPELRHKAVAGWKRLLAEGKLPAHRPAERKSGG